MLNLTESEKPPLNLKNLEERMEKDLNQLLKYRQELIEKTEHINSVAKKLERMVAGLLEKFYVEKTIKITFFKPQYKAAYFKEATGRLKKVILTRDTNYSPELILYPNIHYQLDVIKSIKIVK